MVDLVLVAVGAVVAVALGWWAGHGRGTRTLGETRAELADLRQRLGERERDLASLRAKRDQKVNELLEQLSVAEAERKTLAGQLGALRAEQAALEAALIAERILTRDKLALLNEATQKMETVFKALANEALHLGRETQALDDLIGPLQRSLEKYDEQVRWMERTRAEVYAGLRTELQAVTGHQERLQLEMGSFVQALLHERLSKLAEYFEELRRSLERSAPAGP